MSRSQSGRKSGEGKHNLKFLQEIEAISKALYLDKSHRRRNSDTSLGEAKPNLKEGYSPPKDKRSLWSWKTLKALSHIRNKKFSCCFSLQVHSIQGLPSNLNDLWVYVNLKRHDTVLMTCPVRVCDGNAEFEEQLTYTCSVYGSKSGSHNSVKYEAKDFLLYASMVCYDELDLGKHRIDLTRLLPITFEELEEGNCSGQWSTSFKLSGKAQGAIMNVSFGYSMVENHPNMSKIGPKPRLDEDLKYYPELFDSMQMLYLKLEEENNKASVDNKLEAEARANSCSLNTAKEIVESNVKVNELSKVGQMTNIPSEEEGKPEEDNKDIVDEYPELFDSINKLFLDFEEENSKSPVDEKVEVDSETYSCSFSSANENVESKWVVNELSTFGQMTNVPSMEEAKLEDYEDMLDEHLFSERIHEEGYLSNMKVNELSTVGQMTNIHSKEVVKLEEYNKETLDEYPELCDSIDKLFMKVEEEKFKSSVNEKVKVDFETNESSSSSAKENVDSEWEVNEFSTVGQMTNIPSIEEAELEAYEESVSSNDGDAHESVTDDFLSMLDHEPESPRERLLKQFEKDTSANWDSFFKFDFNQENTRFESDESPSSIKSYMGNIFEGSPSKYSNSNLNRFEGLRPFVRTKTGSILKPINPQLYNDGNHKGILIMQVSSPVVVSAELGEGIMDILQRLTLLRTGKKMMQARKLMPLEDINEKIIQETSWEFSPNMEESTRSEFATIKDLVPLAMEKIESLSVERFQIQSSTSNKDASTNIISGLMDLSLPLDEWMRLDAGEIDGADHISNANSKREMVGGKNGISRKYGLRGNRLTIAVMVQIHDEIQNYESACTPMLGFIQAEMKEIKNEEEQSNKDEFIHKFRVTDVHVAGIDAKVCKKKIPDSRCKRQCTSRWSVANGMKKTNKHPLLKSKILEKGFVTS